MMRGDELVELSGADAGLDLIYLAHRCRGFLTGNRQPARRLSGVYCDCGYPELYEVLDDDGQQAGARCRQCRTEYDQEQYADMTQGPLGARQVVPAPVSRRQPGLMIARLAAPDMG
jgi:hypothetical protein